MNANNHKLNADFAGRILVRLSTDGGQVSAVEIDSTRPGGVTQVFSGRAPDDVVGMLGLIFSLCSTAQTIAGLTAVEAARGISVSSEHSAARDVMRQAEMLTQTAMRVLMDWPRLLGLPPAAAAVRAALAAQLGLEADIYHGANWKIPGGIDMTPNMDAVRARIEVVENVLSSTLYEDELAAKLLAALDQRDLSGFGALTEGAEPETGSLSRQWDAPEVLAARNAFGAGLRARLMARLADLKELPGVMLDAVERLGPGSPVFESQDSDGTGKATVETARGPLTHKVVLKGDQIETYDIDAPTDMNFQGDGVVAQGLIGVDARDAQALNTAAELHVLAIDPCVNCVLDITDA